MIILNTLQVVLLGRVSMPTSQVFPPIKLMLHRVAGSCEHAHLASFPAHQADVAPGELKGGGSHVN